MGRVRRRGLEGEPDHALDSLVTDRARGAGAGIIFAHCGLPYFAPRYVKFAEHNDLVTVREYLARAPTAKSGRCYANVSACATPFRKSYFAQLRELPPSRVLMGSDFPVPVFELSADLREVWDDFKAVLDGQLDRIIIPEGNLLDVNYCELLHAFPGHPMFTNFSTLLALRTT